MLILIYLKRTNFRVYIFSRISRILVDFAKLNTCINTREKINIHKNCWLIQLFFFFFLRINQLQQFFHRYLPAFPLILIKNICRLSLDSTVFFSFFFFLIREKLYSRNFLHFGDSQKFLHEKFSKACHSRK